MMSTIARQVLTKINEGNFSAVGLYANYARQYDSADSIQLAPKPPKQLKMIRNNDGRCTKAIYEYEDGSKLQFNFSKNQGSKFTEVK